MSAIFVDYKCDLNSEQVDKLGFNLVGEGESFADAFVPYLDAQEDILYFSTRFSDFKADYTAQVAELKKMYDKRDFRVVDLNLQSVVAGWVVYQAGVKYRQGKTDGEIVEFVEKIRQEVYGLFVTQSGEVLRTAVNADKVNINSTTNLIYPVVFVKGDRLEILNKAQGKKRAFKILTDILGEYSVNIADYPILVGYYDDEANAEFLKNELRAIYEDVSVIVTKMSNFSAKKYGKNAIFTAFYSTNRA